MMRNRAGCRILSLLLLLALLPLPAAAGSGRWWTFTEKTVPEELRYAVCDYSGEITVTFLGDCTLGGEEKSRRSRIGFVRRIEDNGMEFPMRYMKALTEGDDISVANLEGVLTDRSLQKVQKEYNFSGPTAYTEILTSGSIECITLANNHSHDYGEGGYADTKKALEGAGIAWFSTDAMAVWQSDEGLLIGFLGVSFSLSGDRAKTYNRKMKILKELGCAAVITVMHAGTEYVYTPDNYQDQIVSRAVKAGTSLIIGHHPHVVQGYKVVKGVPVVYSLGNCSFGATTHAKDSDALVVQAGLRLEEAELTEIALHFYPISITSDGHYNNYSPMFLTGKDAERVLKKMRESTGADPGIFTEEEGAVVTVPVKKDD